MTAGSIKTDEVPFSCGDLDVMGIPLERRTAFLKRFSQFKRKASKILSDKIDGPKSAPLNEILKDLAKAIHRLEHNLARRLRNIHRGEIDRAIATAVGRSFSTTVFDEQNEDIVADIPWSEDDCLKPYDVADLVYGLEEAASKVRIERAETCGTGILRAVLAELRKALINKSKQGKDRKGGQPRREEREAVIIAGANLFERFSSEKAKVSKAFLTFYAAVDLEECAPEDAVRRALRKHRKGRAKPTQK